MVAQKCLDNGRTLEYNGIGGGGGGVDNGISDAKWSDYRAKFGLMVCLLW